MGSCADGCGCTACAAERLGSPWRRRSTLASAWRASRRGTLSFWRMAAAADMALSVAPPACEDPVAAHVRETLAMVSDLAELGADFRQLPVGGGPVGNVVLDEEDGQPETVGEEEGAAPLLPELTDQARAEWLEIARRTHDPRKEGIGLPVARQAWTPAGPVNPLSPPGDGSEKGEKTCGVTRFDYPSCWKRLDERVDEKGSGGIWFRGDLVFLEDASHACRCCVFRQLVSDRYFIGEALFHASFLASSPWLYKLDWSGLYGMSGGKREDGSTVESDDKGKEAGVWTDDCHLCLLDTPGPGAGSGEALTAQWNFIGLVFDRCRDWLLIHARHFYARRRTRLRSDGTAQDTAEAVLVTGLGPREGWPQGDASGQQDWIPRGRRKTEDETCKDCE